MTKIKIKKRKRNFTEGFDFWYPAFKLRGMDETSKRDIILPVSILIAALMISGSIIYLVKSGQTAKVAGPSENNQAAAPAGNSGDVMKLGDRDAIMGDPKAPVTIVEYADFQCPFCGRFFTGAEQQIRDTYVKSGKVRLVYRDFAFLGPESLASAAAAECAKDQGKFWLYHDALYTAEIADGQENNGNLNRALFLKLAKDNGLDVASFTSCLDANKYSSVVQKATQDGQGFGVNSTPTIFVNGVMKLGALPFSDFQAVIDKALGSAK